MKFLRVPRVGVEVPFRDSHDRLYLLHEGGKIEPGFGVDGGELDDVVVLLDVCAGHSVARAVGSVDDNRFSHGRGEPILTLQLEVDVTEDECLSTDVDFSVSSGHVTNFTTKWIVFATFFAVEVSIIWIGQLKLIENIRFRD